MKKFFTLLLAVISTMTAFAQTEPTIELQAEVDGNTRTFTIGLATEGTVQIDWGNGEKVTSEKLPVYDSKYSTTKEVTGIVVGDGKVKIYGDNILSFGCPSNVNVGAQVLSLDVTKATALKDLTANANKLTSIDLTKNTELEKLTISNNQLTSIDISKCTKLTTLDITNNLLTAIDITKNQALQTLRISQNKFAGELDLSTNPTIKSVYALGMELNSVKIGNNTAEKPYFSFNNNKLTSIDASGIQDAGNATLWLMGNQLTEIKLPSAKMKTLNISKNNFTLATLPDATTAAKNFTYAPQNDYVIAESYKVGDVLDLSSQTSATLNTQFAVYKSDKTALTEGTDYTVADGKITFLTAQEAVYVTMSSALYSKFTGTSIYKTTVTKVEGSTGINAVTAQGVKVSTAGNEISISGLSQGDAVTVANLGGAVVANFHANSANAHVQAAKGLYIVSINGKAIKVAL